MSGDEFIVLIISGAVVIFGWRTWYLSLKHLWPHYRGENYRRWFAILPVLCGAAIIFILCTLASFDVINNGIYIFFYIIMGLAWLAIGKELMFIFLDLSWRDDAIERVNPAAVFCVTGGVIGLTLIYLGANIGDGPGWWTVVIAGGLATISWFLILFIIGKICKVFDRITIDGDRGTGIRISSFMIASGIILGRGAAGDWTSAYDTLIEFLDAWPVLILAVLAIIVEKGLSHNNPIDTHWATYSLFWGFIYIFLAIAIIIKVLPPLPENPIYYFINVIKVVQAI